MNPDAEDRLRRHVAAILAGAGVPRQSRADLEEELSGHLVQRAQEYIDRGLAAADAAEQAISDFGSAGTLGAELGRTYHSQLWASTVGVLLPAIAPAAERPGVIGWLRFVLGLTTVLTVIALATVATMTPLRALGTSLSLAAGLAGLVLAFQALGRRQRWALWYAVVITVMLLVEGLVQVVAPTQPASVTIPLGSILAAVVLLAVMGGWARLQAFVAPSPRLSRALGVMLGLSLLAPLIVPRALAALPDPSQATPDNLEVVISMTCDRGSVEIPDAPTLIDRKRATLVMDTTWNHTDLLPQGMSAIVTRPDDGDTSGFRVLDLAGPDWLYWSTDNQPGIIDVRTGATAGWWGSTSPSVALLPEDIPGSFTVAIDPQAIRPGHTIRTTWHLYQSSDEAPGWPRVEVAYAHLDRFLLMGTVGCRESVRAREVPPHPPALTEPFRF